LKDASLTIGQVIKNETPYGLRIDVTIQEIKADKPLIYTYNYMLNTLKFKEWLDSMEYLCEGPLAFTARGIQVMIAGGAKKWDKSAFTIENEDGDKMHLNLLHEEVKFVVHRDLFAGQEWEVLIEDAEPVMQTLKAGAEPHRRPFSQVGIIDEDDPPWED